MRCFKLLLSLFALVRVLSVGFALAAEPPFAILGKKPAHVVPVSTPPNAQAVTKAIRMPGIDDGYVPQGLAVADSSVLVAGCQSTSTAIGIEDISFDKNGRIWTVSEAGSIRWSRWTATFPVVFAVDMAKLTPVAA